MNRTSFSRTTGTRARSLGALFVSVAIGLCQACAMDTQESAGPEPEVGCGAHALLPDPYTQCSQILAEHLIAQYEADRDPDLAGHLLNWFCGPGAIAENASLIIDGQPLAAWLGGCAQAQDLYDNSSFAFHALDEVADPEVLQAWQDCMGETRSARDGLVCEIARSEEGADTLRVNYYWNSEDSSPELRMEWVVQNATPKTPPLPSAVHEGVTTTFSCVSQTRITGSSWESARAGTRAMAPCS